MTSRHSVWTFDASLGADVLHLVDHVARAVDGDLGPIACVSTQPNRGYILVREITGDGRRILPAGSVAGHEPDGAVRLFFTTNQVAEAPVFEADRCNEREYYEMLTAYFEPLLPSSARQGDRTGGARRHLHSCVRA